MQQNALIVHAWLSSTNDHWYQWLKTELTNKGYTVYLPEIPTMNSQAPNLQTQMDFIEKTIPLDNNFIIFGHSLGCLLALRLAEKYSFQKIFLVAGWDFNDLTKEHQSFWKTPINHTIIKQHVKQSICISSDADFFVSRFQSEEMTKRLNGTYIQIKGAGHFTTDAGITKIPELLPLI